MKPSRSQTTEPPNKDTPDDRAEEMAIFRAAMRGVTPLHHTKMVPEPRPRHYPDENVRLMEWTCT